MPVPPQKRGPIEVMVLATYHMANPGHDAANMQVDDVLQAKRQRELESLAKQLERFKPTKVAVEQMAAAPSYVWKEKLDENDLKTKRNEVYQIGERIALDSGLGKVYAVDNDGDFDLDPVKTMDARQTGGVRIKDVMHGLQRLVDEGNEKQQKLTIGESLAWMNIPEAIKMNSDFYWESLSISDGDDQPSAKLNAEWFERNLRIWGKVLQIAKPGDRILLIFGQGHAYWLRTLVKEMPGYKLIDPIPYLTSVPSGPTGKLSAK